MKWLKMDCDAQENLDMRKLVDDWGWDWYGRYWAICGKVGMLVTEKQQTFALQTNNGSPFPVKLLANDLGTTVERLTEFCNYLSDNHLIDKLSWQRKTLIYMPKLAERADEYTKKLLTKSRQYPDQEVEVDKIKKEKKKEQEHSAPKSQPNDVSLVIEYGREIQLPDAECEKFFDYYTANGWRVGKNPMKDWKSAVRNWKRNNSKYNGVNNAGNYGGPKQSDATKRATFRHTEQQLKDIESFGESLKQRDRERNERA